MTKAKTIDRLELTRQKFKRKRAQEAPEEHYGVSQCPNCEQMTLIHDGGCEHCPSCGYSRCG